MDPLSELKDVHLPSPVVENWVFSIGWTLTLSVCVLGFIIVLWKIYHQWDALQARRDVFKRLQHLRKAFEYEEDPVAIAIELSQLLRRLAMSVYPNQEVAHLKSDSWLEFLDRTGNTQAFSQGVGRALIASPQQSLTKYRIQELFELVGMWVKYHYGLSKKINGFNYD